MSACEAVVGLSQGSFEYLGNSILTEDLTERRDCGCGFATPPQSLKLQESRRGFTVEEKHCEETIQTCLCVFGQ